MNQSPPLLIFPDAVAQFCLHLRGHPTLEGVSVRSDLRRYVVGERTVYLHRSGGARDRFFDTAYVTVEARAGDDEDACYSVAQAARSLVWSSRATLEWVLAVTEIGGLTLLTSPDEEPLYRFTVAVKMRGTPAP